MSTIRRGVTRALDAIGLKRPVRQGLNMILQAGGLPPVGEPAVFRDLHRLTRGPRPRPETVQGRILFFTMRGWTTHVALETMLGEAAAQRGMEPVFYTCGGPLPLCGITTFRAADPTPCKDCHGYVARYFEALDFPLTTMGDLISADERQAFEQIVTALPDAALEEFEYEGLELGKAVRTSVLWHLLRATPEPRQEWLEALRRFLVSGVLMVQTIERLLDRTDPDRVVVLNGLFFAEQILMQVATRRGIPVTTYERGFMPDSWIFRHDEIACEFRIAGEFREVADTPLNETENRRLDEYLDSRVSGSSDNQQYWPRLEARREAIVEQLGLDPAKPVVAAFSNITWDSAVQDHDIAFDDMFDWLEQTVGFFAGRDDAQLVIRIHPAEVRLQNQESAEGVAEILARRLGGIPPGVTIVPASSDLSSYTLGEMSRCVLVYTSSVGLEFATAGRQVVVAGETHYRGLGFTHDVEDGSEYAGMLEQLLSTEPEQPDIEPARRYAHYFFFRFMVPLSIVREEAGADPRLPMETFEDLAPGRNPNLDLIMGGLLEGKRMMLPGGESG